jgi:hypothetical protein
MGIINTVHHEIHEGETDHGAVEVVTVEVLFQNVFILFGQQAADAGAHKSIIIRREVLAFLGFGNRHLRNDVLVGIQQKAGGTASGVADTVAELGIHQFADELDDVARRAELAVLAGAADFIQQHFINIALDVLKQVAFLFGVPLNLGEDARSDFR